MHYNFAMKNRKCTQAKSLFHFSRLVSHSDLREDNSVPSLFEGTINYITVTTRESFSHRTRKTFYIEILNRVLSFQFFSSLFKKSSDVVMMTIYNFLYQWKLGFNNLFGRFSRKKFFFIDMCSVHMSGYACHAHAHSHSHASLSSCHGDIMTVRDFIEMNCTQNNFK